MNNLYLKNKGRTLHLELNVWAGTCAEKYIIVLLLSFSLDPGDLVCKPYFTS